MRYSPKPFFFGTGLKSIDQTKIYIPKDAAVLTDLIHVPTDRHGILPLAHLASVT
jgi:hypothetical protein